MFKTYSFEQDKKNEDNDKNERIIDEDNFITSKTNNETFNKVYDKLNCRLDFSLLNSSYIAEVKNLNKYSTLKLDKPLVGKYLSFNTFIGYKFKDLDSFGLRFGSAGFGAGNLVQYNLMLAITYSRILFTKNFFSINGEFGIGFYFLETKNDKLKKNN